jgi:hypothetical protein
MPASPASMVPREAGACQHGMQGLFRREHPQDRRGTELRNHLLGNQNLDAGRRAVRIERVGENLARDVKSDAPILCDRRVDNTRQAKTGRQRKPPPKAPASHNSPPQQAVSQDCPGPADAS